MGLDIEMIAKVSTLLTEEEVKRVAVRMQIAFGGHSGGHLLWIERGKQHCLSLLDPSSYKITEAGIPSSIGASYVGLNTLGRYYGPGYERGDLVGLLAIARYLRTAFPGAEVYYGSDSGGGLTLLDGEYEAELWKHFASEGSRSYFDHSRGDETTTVCDFCEVRTNTYSFSATEYITACPSCRAKWKYLRPSGVHVPFVDEKDKR